MTAPYNASPSPLFIVVPPTFPSSAVTRADTPQTFESFERDVERAFRQQYTTISWLFQRVSQLNQEMIAFSRRIGQLESGMNRFRTEEKYGLKQEAIEAIRVQLDTLGQRLNALELSNSEQNLTSTEIQAVRRCWAPLSLKQE